MKLKFLKATVLATAAMAAGAFASPTLAKTLTYTFGSVDGGAYCDGVTLTTVNNATYGGTHTGCTNNDPAGGYNVKVNGGANLDIATTFTSDGDTDAYTFFLYLKGNEWFLYHTVNGVFTQINSGVLINGAPVSPKGAHLKSSRDTNPKALLDRMF
jgi:hypothetical protein